MSKTNLISIEKIEKTIYFIRGEKVMLDRDLARLYEVSTAALNQAVRRNRERFPEDFMFQLTSAEAAELNRSQIVIGSQKHRDPRSRPYAFTEHGVAMVSSVLRSKRAITVNIEIVRAFVVYPHTPFQLTIAETEKRQRLTPSRSQIVILKKIPSRLRINRLKSTASTTYPPATAGGTDCIQVRLCLLSTVTPGFASKVRIRDWMRSVP